MAPTTTETQSTEQIARAAKAAFEESQLVDASERVLALQIIKQELEALRPEIEAANKADLEVLHITLAPRNPDPF